MVTEWFAYNDNVKALIGISENEEIIGFLTSVVNEPSESGPRPDLNEIVQTRAPCVPGSGEPNPENLSLVAPNKGGFDLSSCRSLTVSTISAGAGRFTPARNRSKRMMSSDVSPLYSSHNRLPFLFVTVHPVA